MRVLALDTEFRGSHNRNVTPVCAVIQMEGVELGDVKQLSPLTTVITPHRQRAAA